MDANSQAAAGVVQGQGQSGRPQQAVYDTSQGGHYGPWANVHQGLTGPYKDILTTYWQQTISHLENDTHDYKLHQLPLARIKKVMKADPEVKMISAEAPILFAKGCDIFITELTMRAWIHAEENKRRTLQRSDIASALAKSDMFDFLIDIVPREEAITHTKRTSANPAGGAGGGGSTSSASVAAAAAAAAAAAVAAQQGVTGGGPGQQMPGATHGLADYANMGAHAMGGEADYRQPGMYPVQGQPGAPAGYASGQPQMYGDMDPNIYNTYNMPPTQGGA
ncbi:Transcriptional activator hap5 [Sporothrix epigloea]|uniref:Transcriptional activator hap5 n=1 Tax=Sporothrix epigloea TaxID=1892477 RepID=A0ABP0D338_9PEZI